MCGVNIRPALFSPRVLLSMVSVCVCVGADFHKYVDSEKKGGNADDEFVTITLGKARDSLGGERGRSRESGFPTKLLVNYLSWPLLSRTLSLCDLFSTTSPSLHLSFQYAFHHVSAGRPGFNDFVRIPMGILRVRRADVALALEVES